MALLSRLTEPVCRQAVFKDLLAYAAAPDPSAAVIKDMVEMLATLLDHAGIDPATALREAGLNVAQSRWSQPAWLSTTCCGSFSEAGQSPRGTPNG